MIEILLVLSGSLQYDFQTEVQRQYPCLMQREEMRILLRSKDRAAGFRKLYQERTIDYKTLDQIKKTAVEMGWI